MELRYKFFLITIASLIITACGKTEKPSVTVTEEYSERLIRDLKGSDFSLVLSDMNVSEKGDKLLFQHKYHVLKVEKDSLIVDSLDWEPVNKSFFIKHENDLGMEIVSSHNNKLSRIAKPVGFDWAVGNTEHGEWEQEKSTDSTSTKSSSTHGRVWRSHHSSGLFWYWMLRRPAYQRDYSTNRVYNASGKTYYGENINGTSRYGTNSAYQKRKRSGFFARRKNSSSWRSFSSSKKSASSSRYNGASSTRSRSGGFGK
ncbi:hypothetical protein A8C32_11760 [Flavivirga aquatica]|uniref:Lipoprotein n=1 Tax=Flavivirga aquatica TaxID=1849968 RepID=A0A1E5TDG3_9FLAO|nr:hypothetical protein [Flavivirga aquatica]OEK09388.1 hypothetical protein A8C32_11760 [Flavivirga aquatica]